MAESVTVDHGSVSVTTNTANEADLRTEMEAPAALPLEREGAPAAEAATPGPRRDEQGRFVPKGATAPPAADPPPAAEPPAEPPQARRRDDSLPRHNPIARMNQALAKAAEAERRAQALEAELARARQPALPPGVTSPVTPPILPPTGPGGLPEPQFEQFADQADPYTAYLQAWTRWDRAQGIAQARAEWEAAQTERQRAQSFQERLTTGRQAYPDFDQALTEADTLGLQVSAVMQEAIADSPRAADLVYFLATHPEECLQLAEESSQTPVAAAPVMRRLLESQLAPPSAPRAVPANGGTGAAARAPVSLAKPPVTPVGSSPVVSDEPPGDQASAAEHARYWNRRLKVPGTK